MVEEKEEEAKQRERGDGRETTIPLYEEARRRRVGGYQREREREREGGGGGRVEYSRLEGRGLVVVVRVRGTVRAPVDLCATVESLTGYHHRTTAEPWFTGRGQNGTRSLVARELEGTVEHLVERRKHWYRLRHPIKSRQRTFSVLCPRGFDPDFGNGAPNRPECTPIERESLICFRLPSRDNVKSVLTKPIRR